MATCVTLIQKHPDVQNLNVGLDDVDNFYDINMCLSDNELHKFEDGLEFRNGAMLKMQQKYFLLLKYWLLVLLARLSMSDRSLCRASLVFRVRVGFGY